MDAARPHIRQVPSPLPVFLVYFTAWRSADGQAQFRPDIYRLDGRLAAALLRWPRKPATPSVRGQ